MIFVAIVCNNWIDNRAVYLYKQKFPDEQVLSEYKNEHPEDDYPDEAFVIEWFEATVRR